MNELKFSCPHCDQHIAGDDAWAGRQLDCPACGQSMTVPAPSRPTVTPAPPKRPPVPGPIFPAMTSAHQSGRTSGLAMASTILSLLFCLAPLTSIAGVICGHLARKRLRQDPHLRGASLATTGLVAGYVFSLLAAISIVLVAFVPGAFGLAHRNSGGTHTGPVNPSVSVPSPANPVKPRDNLPGNTGPITPTPTASKVQPATPVAGKVGPSKFSCDAATLQGGWLRLQQGSELRADTKIQIVLFASNKDLSGKTVTVGPGTSGITPHVHLSWKEGGMPQGKAVSSGYTMTLRFEPFEGAIARGHLELELVGVPKVSVKGDFVAAIR